MSDILDRLLAPPDPNRDPLDAVLADENRQRASVFVAQSGNPEANAKALPIARKEGVPLSTVVRQYPAFKSREDQMTWAEIGKKYPAIGNFMADPVNAAVAADDGPELSGLAKAWDETKRLSARSAFMISGGLWGALSATGQLAAKYAPGANLQRAILGNSIDDILASYAQARSQEAQALQARNQTRVKNYVGRNLLVGLDSTLTSAVGVGVGLATRNPEAALGIMGGATGGNEFQRAQDAGVPLEQAAIYATSQGLIEAATEKIPTSNLIKDITAKSPFFKTLARNLIREIPGEEAATILQDLNEWATLNPDRPFSDYLEARPEAALATLIQTASGSGAQVAAGQTTDAALSALDRIHKRRKDAEDAVANARLLNGIDEAGAKTKLKSRSPDVFASLAQALGQENGVSNVYVPAEAVREYLQSNDMSFEDLAWGDDAALQYGDALASGGDIVLPIGDASAKLLGTPAWDAIKDDVRLSAGGQSLSEAQQFENDKADILAQMAEYADINNQLDAAARTKREKLFSSFAERLRAAGYRPDVANQYALLATERADTRASRLGKELTGAELDHIQINQVLPPALSAMIPRDAVAPRPDLLAPVVNAMRAGKTARTESSQRGPSLLQFIAKKGGVEDRGGDLKAMGVASIKGVARKGQVKIIRPHIEGQASMLGIDGTQNSNSPDALALAAWEAGYFPEFKDRPSVNDLLDAIAEGIAGRHRYSSENDNSNISDEIRMAAQELRQLLDQAGLDPETASMKDIEGAVQRYQDAAKGGRGFDQSYADGPRGRVTFNSGKAVIDLFQERDLSTFIHEMGHVWLEELQDDAALAEAPEQLRADWQTVLDWFKANGHAVGKDGVIPVDAHELWARGIEHFVMEGKAPSSALRRAFEHFRSWLVRIYGIADSLRAPITPEIREVMQRMLASDEEIDLAQEEQNLKAVFNDAATAGMTDAEFANYTEAVKASRDEAFDQLLYRTMEAVRRRRTAEYKEARAGVEAKVKEDVDTRPVFRALASLRGGMKLDRGWLRSTFGADVIEQLPKSVPPLHAEKGTDADTIAELSGFDTGKDMVKALIGLQDRREAMKANGDNRSVREATIAEETDAIMAERYGDPLNDGSIEEEALAAVHNERQGELLATELRQIGRRSGDTPSPYRLAKEWAREKISTSAVNDVLSKSAIQRYARAASKAGKDAEAAIIAGDWEKAYRTKQAQMLNNALISEANSVNERIDAAVKRMGRYAKQRTLKSMDQDYLEQIHALLEQVDFKTRSQGSIDRRIGFEAWAKEQKAAGIDVSVPDNFANILGTTNWTRLTVENLLGLDDAVKQIAYLGRFKQKLIDAKEEREFDEVVNEALGKMGDLPPIPPSDLMSPSWGEQLKSRVSTWDAALLKMETIVDWLDGGDADGVFNRVVFRPIADAQTRADDMRAEIHGKLDDALKAVPKETLKRWFDKVSLPELINRETGNPFVLTRQQLISMALNVGNEGNLQRLTDGYGWNRDAVLEALNRELTAEEWQYVQSVWDAIGSLWPELSAMERRVNGVAPEKVESRPVTTPHGTFAGGYFPVVYDSAKNYDAEKSENIEADLFGTKYTRATTRSSATKERAEAVSRPIKLDLGVVHRHVSEVIHDITHREAIINAAKLLSSRRIMEGIDSTLGPEIRKVMMPWLKFVANQWAADRAGNEGIGEFINKLRTNATVVGMGFRATTVMMQIVGYSNSFEAVGAKWVVSAIARTASHPIETFRFVMEKSGEIRHRMDTLDRDIAEGIRAMVGKGNPLTAAKRFAFHGIGYADRIVVIPTWIGAFNKAQAEGANEQDAIYAADKAVRQSQGAASPKDIAAVANGQGQHGQLLKLFTMFYSYMSAVYQRQRTLARDVRRVGVRDVPGLMARAWWLIVVPPILSEILAGRGPGDDDDWGLWALKQMLLQSLGAIPVARDAARPVWDAIAGNKTFDYQLSPLQSAGQALVRVGKDINHLLEGEETKRATRDTLEAVGYWTGLIPGQIAASTQFLVDVGQGEQNPETISDWWQGLTKGKIPEE